MSRATKKICLLSLAAVSLLLTSCNNSEIYPDLSNEVTVNDNSLLTRDDLVYIYEKLHDSSTTGSEVRDLILARYAVNLIGDFTLNDSGEVVLNGYDDTDDSGKLEYVKNHRVYWDKVETEPGSNVYEAQEPTSLTSTITDRVALIKNIVKTKIVETIFTEANDAAYKVDNYFYEYKYARVKYETSRIGDFSEDLSVEGAKNIYDKEWEEDYSTSLPENFPFTNKILIDNTVTTDDIYSIIGTSNSTGAPVLHIGLYSDYINRDIIPDILNTLLVEQYILDNQYTTLSRTQARKVNYVSISTDTTNINSARRLIETFVNQYIVGADANEPIDFTVLQDAWIGNVFDFETNSVLVGKEAANSLLVDAQFELIENHDETDPLLYEGKNTTYIDGKENHYFYRNTEYGNLMLNFAKINTDANDAISNEQQSSFTESNTYSVTEGFKIKNDELKTHDYTVNDWGTKDNGLNNLPTAIKDVLFKYNVSVDTPTNTNEFIQSDYVVEESGHYYLKKQDAQSTQLIDSIVLRDSTTFYIVEIEDAISQSKLSLNSDAYTTIEKEEIAREIGYTMASGDTYRNSAYLYYLEQLDIQYHDQSIYDYMLETYPDLFEE